jgi:hypothetical protein
LQHSSRAQCRVRGVVRLVPAVQQDGNVDIICIKPLGDGTFMAFALSVDTALWIAFPLVAGRVATCGRGTPGKRPSRRLGGTVTANPIKDAE